MGANRCHLMRGGHRTRTRVIEWLDPDTGLRSKDPFDTAPEVNQWWLDVLRVGRITVCTNHYRYRSFQGCRAPASAPN